ncbi:MAG: hypothetical protein V8Q37_06380 [Angelakisella sp.]
MWKKVLDRALVFGTGASFDSLLETIWRGHAHWSMRPDRRAGAADRLHGGAAEPTIPYGGDACVPRG